jgi:hypothetical protein
MKMFWKVAIGMVAGGLAAFLIARHERHPTQQTGYEDLSNAATVGLKPMPVRWVTNINITHFAGPTNYRTVVAGDPKAPLLILTNVIDVRLHEPNCQLVRWRGPDGRTNEFHAWLVPVKLME